MPYRAERDATVPKVIGTTRNAEGERVEHYESVTYAEGSIVFEEDIAPNVLRRLEEGDDHVSSLLRYVDEAEARKILSEQSQGFPPQSVEEGELPHQEVRFAEERQQSASPAVGPDHEVSNGPPYEAPPAGDGQASNGGQHVVTEDQTVGQGTDAVQASDEEEPEASIDAESEEPVSDAEVVDEDQPVEEAETDPYDEMNKADLLQAAKEKKISGRTKMSEDELREALRAE